ncbi:MAG: hypothetical protein ABL958_19960, partial [Bdellovibrionia bacterium]
MECKTKQLLKCLVNVMVLLGMVACNNHASENAPTPPVDAESNSGKKGDRLLGIDVNHSRDPSSGDTFEKALAEAQKAGIDFLTLHLNWSSIEPGHDDNFSF